MPTDDASYHGMFHDDSFAVESDFHGADTFCAISAAPHDAISGGLIGPISHARSQRNAAAARTDLGRPGIKNQLPRAANRDQGPASSFMRGTMIISMRGPVAIEDLQPGDRVFTRDNGFQDIRWIGSYSAQARGRFAPVVIAEGAMGNDEELWVSQTNSLLFQGWKAELLTGESEVLVPAKLLINNTTIRAEIGGQVDYFLIMFDHHQVILANGCLAASFHPGQSGLGALSKAKQSEIDLLFPQIARLGGQAYGSFARRVVRSHEAALLLEDAA